MAQIDITPLKIDPLSRNDVCSLAYDRFDADKGLLAIPVVERGKPFGLLRRHEFMLRLADHYGRPLFDKRPVTELMDANPLFVELGTSIDTVNMMLIDAGDKTFQTGFIFVENGFYVGTGTAYALLKANMEKEKRHSEELDLALVEARAANQTKTNFLANMSHELRTPLNAIIGFSEFIVERAEKNAAGKLPNTYDYLDYIKNIHQSGHHLLSIINSILDMSKLEADAFVLKEDYGDPVAVVQQAVSILEGQAAAKKIAIATHYAKHLPLLFADMQVCRQIVLNLLSNAIKFSRSGSSISVCVILADDGGLLISVRDRGIGIAEEDIEKVKRPFMQADTNLSRQHEGTGLGLPLVEAFINAHNGQFRLNSKQGVGTTASVWFPPARLQAGQANIFDVI